MGNPQKVELAPEAYSKEIRPLLARIWGDDRARYRDSIIGMIERGDAILFVARRDGRALGALIVAMQRAPEKLVCVLGMVTLPRTGFAWGPALWAPVRELFKKTGADGVRAEARTEANRRRLARLGFAPVSTVMVAPC